MIAAWIDGVSSAQTASVPVAERKLTVSVLPKHCGVGEEELLLCKASDGAKAWRGATAEEEEGLRFQADTKARAQRENAACQRDDPRSGATGARTS